MGEKLVEAVVAIATAVIGIAIIAVLVGRQSQTSSVISSAGSAFSNIIRQAVAPVSGGGIA
ncbi:MAG TPA: hypothetical protein VN785_12225 [Candidatus Angelobacter sp.]|nr:hypothetical protein [Candidatus Angelobacter sp.]